MNSRGSLFRRPALHLGCVARCALPALIILLLPSLVLADRPISFRNDVMAVLSKAGCSAGACHGNKNGKAGFKLSLRGQDPDVDYLTLTRDLFARRIDLLDPAQSLILLKPTAQISHEGGLRFRSDSREFETLFQWIAQGAERDGPATPRLVRLDVSPLQQVLTQSDSALTQLQLSVHATFSDGSRRDVTRLACYEQSAELATISPEGLVRSDRLGETTIIVRYLHLQQPVRLAFIPSRPDFHWQAPPPANYIDEHIFAKLRRLRINPSQPATDGEFLRRAHLDLLGILPTAEEAAAFLDDPRSDKCARLIDHLLDRPEFADFWAIKWADLLKLEERTLDRKGVQSFHRWIQTSIAQNKPLDRFARELISARGSTYANPPANYWRANRDPITRGEATAQLFLGVRLQCAQCHNHPFDRWTQEDYYNWAAVFSRIDYKVLENRRRDNNDRHEFIGEQVVYIARQGAVKDPRTGKPAAPRLLGEDEPLTAEDNLHALAGWLTSPDNPFFARMQANRIWYHLMGRGLVDPIDDFRATNPPTHPELLDALAADLVAHNYDMRHLIRVITSSRTYALSSIPNDTNHEDETNYSHTLPRRLSAEQLLDACHQVTGVPTRFNGYPPGTRAGQITGVEAIRSRDRRPSPDDRFLALFGKPQRLLACECERSTDATLAQIFTLISGPQITALISHADNRLTGLLASGKSSAELISELYLASLSRMPTQQEIHRTVSYLDSSEDRRQALEDITWALLNAKEFVLRK